MEIPLVINPDLPQLRTQWKDAGKNIMYTDISPSGKRAIITARGEVFTVPVKDGSSRNVSTDGRTHEYTAIWSPEGDQIAYITESEGGQSLVLKDQSGMGEARVYELGPYFYRLLAWGAGDDSRIIFQDNHLSLYAIGLSGGSINKIAAGARRENIEVSISGDGKWLAYTQEQENYNRDLVLLNFDSGASSVVSDGKADIASPAFSRDGKYLYFAASTNSGPIQVGLNMSSQEKPYRAGLYALVLSADGQSPVLAGQGDENEDDDEASNADDKKEAKGKTKKDDGEKIAETRIDLKNLSQRIVALPVAERNYSDLAVGKDDNLYYIQASQPGASMEPPGTKAGAENVLLSFDFEKKEEKTLLTGLNRFVISTKGTHMIISRADGSLEVAEISDELKPEKLKLSGLRLRVNPREEWTQIFDEAWRMEKEYFYANNLHGLDWLAVYERYRPLVDHLGRREDLSALLIEMIAELQVGHNRTGGGDIYKEQGAKTGLLGANFRINNGRYQLARVYSGESWNPFIKAPLANPGNEVREGEYILAVNGRVGYVYLPNMAGAGYTFFNRMFFAQVDKQAMIIDERSNAGGQAANYITDVLSCRHLSGWLDRDGKTYATPAGAVHGPKVMLIDQDAGSGGDFLPYSFRQLERGKRGSRTGHRGGS